MVHMSTEFRVPTVPNYLGGHTMSLELFFRIILSAYHSLSTVSRPNDDWMRAAPSRSSFIQNFHVRVSATEIEPERALVCPVPNQLNAPEAVQRRHLRVRRVVRALLPEKNKINCSLFFALNCSTFVD